VAIFTITLSISTRRLWLEAKRASEIALRNAEAAETSARAADATAQTAVRALKELERPWIFVEQVHMQRCEEELEDIVPNYFWISFVCRNVGRAPAVIEDFFIKLVDKKEIGAVPDYSQPRHQLNCPGTVGVGEEFETSKLGPAPQRGVAPAAVIFYVVYGQCIYRDLAGNRHHTAFSCEVSPHMVASSSRPNPAYDYWD
jgi:hypothetical protein